MTAETKQIVLKEIGSKWSKFPSPQVAGEYGLEEAQAQRDVDALLKGRHI